MRTKTGFCGQRMIAVAAVLLTIGFASLAQAQGPGRSNEGRGRIGAGQWDRQQGNDRLADRLELTAEQKEAIAEIRTKSRTDNVELRKQIMRLRNEMRGEMLKDDPAGKTVVGLTKKIGDLRTQLQTNRLETRLAVRKLLTPDQRDKMLMFEGRHGQHGQKGQRGPRRGGRQGGQGHGAGGPGRCGGGDRQAGSCVAQ